MNERIKELADEATVWEGMENGYIFDKEKFARLIVQECIWAFHETRTEPSLEKFILDRLGINNESR